MKRYDNIMQDNVHAPKTDNNIWLKNNQLYYYINGKWQLIGGGLSPEELDKLNKAIEDINSLNSGEGIDNLNEIKKFLEGFKDNENLKEIVDGIQCDVDTITEEEINNLFN